jgi:hypothetical protein
MNANRLFSRTAVLVSAAALAFSILLGAGVTHAPAATHVTAQDTGSTTGGGNNGWQ